MQEDLNILPLNSEEFDNIIEKLKLLGIDHEKFDFCEAYVIDVKGKRFLIIDQEVYNTLSYDYKKILIAHEIAHGIDGIEDEEEADFMALNYLEPKQQEILKSLWKERHGKTFETYEKILCSVGSKT